MLEGGVRYIDACNGDLYVVLEKAPDEENDRMLALANISLGYIMLDFQEPFELEKDLERYKDLVRIRERSI
jgi:hypothetical protein